MNINATLLGQAIAFTLFVIFCLKFVWPPIMAAMAEREKKIADGLAAADRASHDLELAKQRIRQYMEAFKQEGVRITENLDTLPA